MRNLLLSRAAQKELSRLPANAAEAIATKILALREDPLPQDVKRLKISRFYRLRFGHYRVVYSFDASAVTIAVIERRDAVYRKTRRL
jgi:mRNA-degrading endonuclease RelE of RelBE toxin-antitoxin system